MATSPHRLRDVPTTSGVTWVVCDGQGLPVSAVHDYLSSIRGLDQAAPATVKTYGRHIAALLTWTTHRQLAWHDLKFTDIAEFMGTYRAGLHPVPKRGGGERAQLTMRNAASAIKGFYEFHQLETGLVSPELRLTATSLSRQDANESNKFLAHIERRKVDIQKNRLMPKGEDEPETKIINFEQDFHLLLKAANSSRDRLFLSAMYDLGLRINGALALHHGDLDVRKKFVTVVPRNANVNGAATKSKRSFVVHDGLGRFFEFYRDYLLTEILPRNIESDFVFVNLDRHPVGAPASASNMSDQVKAIGRRAGIKLHPHMLRHTHLTALAKAGWTTSEIAARAGQRSARSADRYIHLTADDLVQRMDQTKHLVWAGTSLSDDQQ